MQMGRQPAGQNGPTDARQPTTSSSATPQEQSFQVAAPTISLPKGGGAIRGMGEKFAANPVTGTGSMSVPIATSPGRSGFGPQLALSYDSGAGNGPFGFGWSLSLPSITRKTDKGLPQYFDAVDSDVFILSGAEDLVPVLVQHPDGQWGPESVPERTVGGQVYRIRRYRPRIEGLFARIERWSNQSDPTDVFWRSISKDNITTWYGRRAESRIADPADPTRIFSWLICESHDDKGNVLVYGYKPEDSNGVLQSHVNEANRTDSSRSSNRYLKRIRYGNRVPYFHELNAEAPWPEPPGTQLEDGSAHWLFEAIFDYDDHDPDVPTPAETSPWPVRQDPFSSYRAGFEVRTYRLCQRVLMFHHFPGEENVEANCLVRSTDFSYSHEQDPTSARNPVYTFLREVTQVGYRRDNGGYLRRSLPPVAFEYTQPTVQDLIEEVDAKSLENLPVGLDGTAYQWQDLHGEGIPGILTEQGGAWFYKRNLSPINLRPHNGGLQTEALFAPVETVAVKPNLSVAGGQAQFMDLAGDGQLDLVMMDGPTPGFYEHDHAEGWDPFRPFTARLNRTMQDPNLKFVDLDGDGHADVLITEQDALVWHPSLAEDGFDEARRVAQALDEEQGPKLVFADGTESIHLADLSGDGLTDLIRIRNGEVCYWPNLGYGRFGAKVTMDHAPWFDHPDQFDHKRIRLADIDGTGTTDIIYLHAGGVRLYFNQSGNSWSDATILDLFPQGDDIVSIVPTDLLGNGTACLVWSSPLTGDAQRPMRYVNLMGSEKPHLLVRTVNNLGAETHVTYAPSTKFYLLDKQAGTPWITKLPFPVHVVERVETRDRISGNRFVTRYSYHHGYFDGEEREFRGFGRVDQLDTEEFAALTADNTLPPGTNSDEASHVPPVRTKTWFHTGLYMGRAHVSDFFARLLDLRDRGEYYREPAWHEDDEEAARHLLPDTILPEGLTVDEEREACRALKGSMLRQEVYALDGTDREEHPYSVTEQNFTIRTLQPRGTNRHGVFFTHAREAITYHYERNPADPRIQHALTLEVDEFGNVLRQAAIGYGRRQPDQHLLQDDQEKQTQQLITYTENHVTNAVESNDHYRTPLPSESQTFELTGLAGPAANHRYSLSEMLSAGDDAETIPYEAAPTGNVLQRRLIEHVRTRYRPNDLGESLGNPLALLPLGVLESLALPGESYKLAFTPSLITQVYGDRVTDSMLQDEGRYVHSEGDDNWWIRAGRIFLSPNTDDTAAAELQHARDHFFLPHRFRDPFHMETLNTESVVTYDHPYDLLVLDTRDAVNNRVTAGERSADGTNITPEIDYRVLQPRLMTDPNGNRAAVAFDTLALVAGTAVMGKPTENLGDLLEDDFDGDLTQDQIDAFFADPRGPLATELLGTATSRIIYDETRFQRLALPAFAASIVRETHVSELGAGEHSVVQVSLSYSDGFGREIQKKVQAEPGPVSQRDGNGAILVGPDSQPVLTTNEVNPRWVGSGWTIFNNKGKPVRQYEPFFTDQHQFEFDVRIGVSPVLFYDPVERVVATLHPNHTWEKVVFSPWRQETWDVNDTVLIADPATDPDVGAYFIRLDNREYLPTWHTQRIGGAMGNREQSAANKAAAHADTPTTAHFDTLGRPFLTFADNGPDPDQPGPHRFFATRAELDIEGNQRAVRDAIVQAGDPLGRIVMRYDYDLLSTQIHSASMEAGQRWMLNDVAGQPIRSWNSRGHLFRFEYDALHRAVRSFVQGSDPENPTGEILFGRTDYGEGQDNDTTLNLRTKAFRVYDSAGIVTSETYDFKGNLRQGSRQLVAEYRTRPDWSGNPALEAEIFNSITTYDALNRPLTLTTPDNSVLRPTYNEANFLERMEVNLRGSAVATVFVRDIDYDAKGQRELIEYGNGVITRYEYDPLTFRLTRLQTLRGTEPLQDLSYTHDPVGNITDIRDEAQQTIYFNNQVVEPHADYTYDAIYRLITATGREHIGQAAAPQTSWNDEGRVRLSHPHNGQAMRMYTEQYHYDEVGNFLELIHQAGSGSWTRSYTYEEASLIEPGKQSNRLSQTSVGDVDEPYTHDIHGNMTHMQHLPLMQWDFQDQLQASARQVVNNGGVPETTWYVYDAAGQRVRKVTERQATSTRRNERIYLGGLEIYREYPVDGTAPSLERQTLHVMDDKQRIALVETESLNIASPITIHSSLIRYQLGNHLGSASVELDADAAMISYEEYHPYGSTSYQAGRSVAEVSLKRYRYTGKERDEETGLNYHGARYYAPWLGRWTAADISGVTDGVNLFAYVRNNPLRYSDPSGFSGEEQTQHPGYSSDEIDPQTGSFLIEPFTDPAPSNASTVLELNQTEPLAISKAAKFIHEHPESQTAFFESHLYTSFQKEIILNDLRALRVQEYIRSAKERENQEVISRVGSGPAKIIEGRELMYLAVRGIEAIKNSGGLAGPALLTSKPVDQRLAEAELIATSANFLALKGAGARSLASVTRIQALSPKRRLDPTPPIRMSDSPSVKIQLKVRLNEKGYRQTKYNWSEQGIKYEARWHERTPRAPKEQGNSWVITRTFPGRPGKSPATQVFTMDKGWVPHHKWQAAIAARNARNATPEQQSLLDSGHWPEYLSDLGVFTR